MFKVGHRQSHPGKFCNCVSKRKTFFTPTGRVPGATFNGDIYISRRSRISSPTIQNFNPPIPINKLQTSEKLLSASC